MQIKSPMQVVFDQHKLTAKRAEAARFRGQSLLQLS